MAYVSGDRLVRMQFRTTTANGVFEHFNTLSFSNAFDREDLALDVQDWFNDTNCWSEPLSSITVLEKITVEDLTGALASFELLVSEAGLGGATSVSPQVSWVITLRSNVGGRSGRGRLYVGGMATDYIAVGGARWTSGGTPTLDDIAQNMLASSNSFSRTGASWCVNSRKNEELHNIVAVTSNFEYLGTQRRRAQLD